MLKTFLRTLSLFLLAFVLFLPALALAQATADPAVTFDQLVQQVFGTISTWKTAGWLAGAVALVNVLSNVLKYQPIADFLAKQNIGWWLRPAIAILLGIVGGVFSNIVMGTNIGLSILIALVSGLGSTGFHELMTIWNTKTQAERGVGSLIVDAVTTGLAPVAPLDPQAPPVPAVKDPLVELQNKLGDISALPAEARLAALAQLGKKA
ncbi:MAG: hypothetical protein KJ648_07055 [Candidatus Omnitrophica bacterium]|nr:hypothetical protein [Candidatus Omnitrophota bacterium]MBU1767841.1 hypothetical protein [Candidatus Omnitrophota bacterium]